MEKGALELKEADKVKGNTDPSFKLALDIEVATDIKQVLETRILNSKVEFTLREVLGIAKKEFHEVIIDIIRRKRQVTDIVFFCTRRRNQGGATGALNRGISGQKEERHKATTVPRTQNHK